MAPGPIEHISTVPSTGETAPPGSMGVAGGVRLAAGTDFCAVCSAEIGNQPRMVHTASRTPQQT